MYIWKEILRNQIQPTLDRALTVIQQEPTYISWAIKYKAAIENFFKRYTWAIEMAENHLNAPLCKQLDAACPELAASKMLHDKAIRVALSSGADCVLNGMTRPTHILQSLQAATRYDRLPQSEVARILEPLNTSA
jgi:hypothetical protein